MLKPLLSVPLALALHAHGQEPLAAPHGTVRIDMEVTENGQVHRITKEFDAEDEAQVQDALRELGMMDHTEAGPDWAESAVTYLGVSTRSLTPAEQRERRAKKGAVVLIVEPGSPAAGLDLKEGDLITRAGGAEVDGPARLAELVRARKPGEELELAWQRSGRTMTGSARLGERPDRLAMAPFWDEGPDESAAYLGVTPGKQEGGEPGALIGAVEPGSAASAMGLEAGDRIVAINGEPVADFEALAKAVRGMRPGERIALSVLRDGQPQEHAGELGERRGHSYFKPGQGGGITWNGIAPEDRDMLRREMENLRRQMDELMGSTGRESRSPRGQARPLSAEEKALLAGKGVALDKELSLLGLSASAMPGGRFRLRFEVTERGDLTVEAYGADGVRVYQERITAFKGRYERVLDLSDQPAGDCFVVIAQGGRAAAMKVAKE